MKKMLEYQFTIWKEGVKRGYFDTSFIMEKISTDLTKITLYEEFLKLPFMYKDEIRNSTPFKRTNTSMKDIYSIFSSSGSTGKPTYYIYSMKDMEIYNECSKRILSNVGIKEEDIGAILMPITSYAMSHCMMWQFSAVKASYVVCSLPSQNNIVELIRSLPVTCLASIPDIVYNLPLTQEVLDITRKSKVKKILVGGNYLSEHKRKRIEQIWGGECYNLYGISEIFGPLAGECEYKDGFHYDPNIILIEIINPDTLQPVNEGEVGVAVYTTLWSKGFPLLRYWSDDFLLLETEICACGNNFPKFRFRGRKQDCTKIKSNEYLFPIDVEEILMENGFYGEFQIEFHENMHAYVVKIEKEDIRDINIEKTTEDLSIIFQCDCQVTFSPIGSIDFQNSKKFRFMSV